MYVECCFNDLDDVYVLYFLLCCFFNYQKGNFKIVQNEFFQKGEKENFNFKKIINLFIVVFLVIKINFGIQQMYDNFFGERII